MLRGGVDIATLAVRLDTPPRLFYAGLEIDLVCSVKGAVRLPC